MSMNKESADEANTLLMVILKRIKISHGALWMQKLSVTEYAKTFSLTWMEKCIWNGEQISIFLLD